MIFPAHAFGFVAFGIVMCLFSTELMYAFEYNLFRCLDVFKISLIPSSFQRASSIIIGIFNFAFGIIAALFMVLTSEYKQNLLYLMFVTPTPEKKEKSYIGSTFLM